MLTITRHTNVSSLWFNNNSSSIANTYATGSVSGNNQVGGLVDLNNNSAALPTVIPPAAPAEIMKSAALLAPMMAKQHY